MAAPLRDTLRERVTLRSLLGWLVALAVLRAVVDPSPAQFATTVVSMTVFGLTEVLSDVYDLRQSVRHGGFGLYALVGGSALALFDDGTHWLPAVFLLAGAWFVLDAVQTLRHEGATEDAPDGHEVYHDYVARRVHDSLEERPRTRRELSEALDADDEAIDAAVEWLRSRDILVKRGSELRVEPVDDGFVGRTRDRLAAFTRRVSRPVRLELGRESAERSPASRAAGTDRAGDLADGNGQSSDPDPTAESSPAVGGADDREREAARR